jgi:outer membrane phospholipase A
MNLSIRLFAAVALTLGTNLLAAEPPLLYTLATPTARIAPGAALDIELAVLNRSKTEASADLPGALETEIGSFTDRSTIRLISSAGTPSTNLRIAPGGFELRRYRVTVPQTIGAGSVVLELRLAGVDPTRTALEVASALVGTSDGTAAVSQRPPTTLIRAEPAAAELRRMFAARLGPHEPIYFIYGAETPAAKFQFSFKYKLLDFEGLGPQRMARTLQFAFTQRSLWDFEGESSPFYDTSYMPEIMYQALTPKAEKRDRWFSWLGLQAAFKHESNGRDGEISRSLNTVYARPVFAFGRLDGWHLLAIPEVFTYATSNEENPGLADYRGFGRLQLVLGRNDGPSLLATLAAGKDFERRSLQLDLTLPLRTKLLKFESYLLIQYFNGYGESLRAYRDESESLRAGMSLVR